MCLIFVLCAVVVVSAAWWAFDSPRSNDTGRTHVKGNTIAATIGVDPQRVEPFPNRILTVSLNDELFPEPILEQPAAEARSQKLAVDLIAITTEGSAQSVFGYDRVKNEYFTASIGESIPSGPIVESVGADSVVFQINGRTAKLELKP